MKTTAQPIPQTANRIINSVLNNKRHFIILLLGFSSGLPAALTASTLQAWFTEAGISLRTIGAVTLLGIPYCFVFLWAPLFDYVKIPGVDLRQGWLFLTQVGLAIAIATMANFTPQEIVTFGTYSIPWLMVFSFITVILSTSQDSVINAYQTEILPQEERGLGAAIYISGWRAGAIISGALALVLAKQWGWKETYWLMASLMSIGMIATWLAPQPRIIRQVTTNIFHAIVAPIKDFFHRYGLKTASLFFLLIITYKVGDALTLALNTTFLLRYVGFDLVTIGLINKTISLISALLGGITAGILMTRLSIYRSLIVFGAIQSIATLSYVAMAYFGKNLFLLIFAAFTENFCSGMGTIALFALIMSLCNHHYTAAQFSLLSASAFLARTIAGPVAAIMTDAMGWLLFFVACFILSLPTLVFVYSNKNAILQLNKTEKSA